MDHKDLDVWKKGIELVEQVYSMSSAFPDSERFGLTSQIRRAAVSIPSNIAEGTSKRTNRHFIQYLENSLGSAFEWETQLIIAYSEEYISEERFKECELKIQEIQKMISRFIDGLDMS